MTFVVIRYDVLPFAPKPIDSEVKTGYYITVTGNGNGYGIGNGNGYGKISKRV
jgi:hypothetical protein